MTRWVPLLASVVVGAVGVGCDPQTSLPPQFEVYSEPSIGRTLEGRLRLVSRAPSGEQATPILPGSVTIVSWPELVAVEATGTITSDDPSLFAVDFLPGGLVADRWYALRWEVDVPRDHGLGSAIVVSEGVYAWPFWSTSGPYPIGMTYFDESGHAIVGYTAEVAEGADFSATITQSETTCTLTVDRADLLGGACSSPLGAGVPVTLDVSGLVSAGTGMPVPAVMLELTLVESEAGVGAAIPPPRVMPTLD